MNYRHSYHAGNFADVFKHIVLLACLDYLQKKETPVFVLDTHGGAGIYDLTSEEARKTGEWEAGAGRIAALASRADVQPPLQAYVEAIAADLTRNRYPGSPLLTARRLRAHDRLIASELHPDTFRALTATLAPFARAKALLSDGYRCVRACLPPKERRGLVLVDPPFESKDEFAMLMQQMGEWKKRWATGVFLVWHPLKTHLPVDALRRAAAELGLPRTLAAEALSRPNDEPGVLNGCGLILFNAPYTVPDALRSAMPDITRALSLYRGEIYSLTE